MSTLVERARSTRDKLDSQEKALGALVAELERRGVTFRRDGERLIVSSWASLPPDLQDAIRRHKAGLLAITDRRAITDQRAITDRRAPVVRVVDVPGYGPCVYRALADGWVTFRTRAGVAGSCVAWAATENGVALGPWPAEDRSRWVADPRPDLTTDSALWGTILTALYDLEGPGEVQVSAFSAWRCARLLGALLTITADGYLEMGAEEAEDQSEIDELLALHPRALGANLDEIIREASQNREREIARGNQAEREDQADRYRRTEGGG